MAETPKPSRPGDVVLREVDANRWQLVGEAERRPGQPARGARRQAVADVTGGEPKAGDVHAAVLRSEWRVAMDL